MLRVGHLSVDDVERAVALSSGVGWNQTPEDWARMLALAPEGVFGAFDAERLVATSSLVAYGDALAWIGMMIVDTAYRRRGLGTRLLDAALAAAPVASTRVIGLDATDLGVPLYRRRGFVAVEPIDRWGGTLSTARWPSGADVTAVGRGADEVGADEVGAIAVRAAEIRAVEIRAVEIRAVEIRAVEIRAVEPSDTASLAAWDAHRTGIPRTALIMQLLRAPHAHGWLAQRSGQLVGYAVVRPGRTQRHLGPLVADDATTARALLASVADGLDGAPLFADVVRSDATSAVFASVGLRVERRLTRMTRSRPRRVLSGIPVWATAGLEWG